MTGKESDCRDFDLISCMADVVHSRICVIPHSFLV
jgi:hypothetical protein